MAWFEGFLSGRGGGRICGGAEPGSECGVREVCGGEVVGANLGF